MLNALIIFFSYLSSPNIRIMEKELNNKKYKLFTKNLTQTEFNILKREIKFLELNRLRALVQDKLD
tara:strand:+ start:208 stop:405 length:198 start_codon:yes stop_codon:yes gene_type:complete